MVWTPVGRPEREIAVSVSQWQEGAIPGHRLFLQSLPTLSSDLPLQPWNLTQPAQEHINYSLSPLQ